MHAIWSGVISFGLVNIPVNLYSASQETSFNFDFLHKKDLSRIRYAKICKAEDKEVSFQEIVRGIEVKKGQYVVLQDKDFEQAYPRATRTIEIEDFVDEQSIDAIYIDKPYFLEPDMTSSKPYQLLRRALEKTGKVAVARYVLRHKEYLAMIKPMDQMLLLVQLRFQHELRSTKDLRLAAESEATPKEMAIATALIEKLSTEFHPESYQDRYTKKIEALIQEKAKKKSITPKEEAPEPTHVTDLMATLKASLEHHRHRVAHAA